MGDDIWTYFGGSVKALGEPVNGKAKVGGYLVLYGTPSQRDASGEYFNPSTFFGSHKGDGQDVYFHHAQVIHPQLKSYADHNFHPMSTREDELGLFAETVLDMSDDYERKIYELVRAGKLGWSSGAAQHLVRKSADGCITRWPIAEGSLTPEPCEPRLKGAIVPLKSLPPLDVKFMGSSDFGAGAALVPNAQHGEKHVWRNEGESVNDCVARKLHIIKQEQPSLAHEAALGKAEGMCRETKVIKFDPKMAGKCVRFSGKSYLIGDDGAAIEYVEIKPETKATPAKAPKAILNFSHTKGTLGQQMLQALHAHLKTLSGEYKTIHRGMEPGATINPAIEEVSESLAMSLELCEEHYTKHFPDAPPLAAKSTKTSDQVCENQACPNYGQSHENCQCHKSMKGDGSETDHEAGEESDENAPGGERKTDYALYEANREEVGVTTGHDQPKKDGDHTFGIDAGLYHAHLGLSSLPPAHKDGHTFGIDAGLYHAHLGLSSLPTEQDPEANDAADVTDPTVKDDDEYLGHNVGPVRLSLGPAKAAHDVSPGRASSRKSESFDEEYAKMTPAQKAWVDAEVREITRLAARKRMLTRHEERMRRAGQKRLQQRAARN